MQVPGVQRVNRRELMITGITTLLLVVKQAPVILIGLLAMYMFKIMYAFAADHYQDKTNWCR